MVPHDFSKRGQPTLIALFILRLLPAFFFLIVIILVAAFKNSFIVALGQLNGQSLALIDQMFMYLISGGLIVFVLITLLLAFIAWLEYISFSYMFDPSAFKIKSGIFHITEQSIPFRQIQNVDIKRSLLYRFIGMSRVVILTAGRDDIPQDGHDSNSIVIDLIDKQQADEIHDELLKLSTHQAAHGLSHPTSFTS